MYQLVGRQGCGAFAWLCYQRLILIISGPRYMDNRYLSLDNR